MFFFYFNRHDFIQTLAVIQFQNEILNSSDLMSNSLTSQRLANKSNTNDELNIIAR